MIVGPTPARPRKVLGCLLLATCTVLTACATERPLVTTHATQPSRIDTPSNDSMPVQRPHEFPRLVAADSVARNFTTFIGTIRSESDLDRNRFWTAMQLPPKEHDEAQYFAKEDGYQAFSQQLEDTGGSYLVSFTESTKEPRTKSVCLEFDGAADPPATGTKCGIDIDQFRKSITAAGFSEGPVEPSRFNNETLGKTWFTFIRGDIFVNVLAQEVRGDASAEYRHACIRSIEVPVTAAAEK